MRIPEPPTYSNLYLLTIILLCIVHEMQLATVSWALTTYTYLAMSGAYLAWRAAYKRYLIRLVQKSYLYLAELSIYADEVEDKNARLSAKITEVDARAIIAGFAMLELHVKMLVLEVQTVELRGTAAENGARTVELQARAEELEGESERLRGLVADLRVAAAEMRVMARELRATVDAGRRKTEVSARRWRL